MKYWDKYKHYIAPILLVEVVLVLVDVVVDVLVFNKQIEKEAFRSGLDRMFDVCNTENLIFIEDASKYSKIACQKVM